MTLACAAAAPAAGYAPRVPESFFGVSAPQLWSSYTESGRFAKRDAQLDAMKRNGIDWVRIEIGRPEIEPQAPAGDEHSYDWAPADNLVAALASREMELMAILWRRPTWARAADAADNGWRPRHRPRRRSSRAPPPGETTRDARPAFKFRGEASEFVCRFDASKWQHCTDRDFQPEQVLVKCKLDRASWRTCSEPERLRGLTPGKHRLRAGAVDEAGNKSIVAKRWRVWRRR